jgi:curved DNA-binding protein CbpA
VNLYEVLGVASDASADEIRSAYRLRARQLHPDNPGAPEDAEERMAELNHAYAVLHDPSHRRAYAQSTGAGGSSGLDSHSEASAFVEVAPVQSSSIQSAVVAVLGAFGAIVVGLGFAALSGGLIAVGIVMLLGCGLGSVVRLRQGLGDSRRTHRSR